MVRVLHQPRKKRRPQPTAATEKLSPPVLYDRWLLLAFFCLLGTGLLMVASASAPMAERELGNSFYFIQRQAVFSFMGLLLLWSMLQLDTHYWQRTSMLLLFISIALLIVVLIPGIGRTVNGSTRWIPLGFFNIQVSEIVKLFFIAYLASYLARCQDEVRQRWSGFFKPMLLLSTVALLLLL